ncbi:hypothetical protein GJU41_19525 [Bacillus idriensis]|uniref:Cell wall-binding repeat-containing protein n=1 Tax=Metabacillus idriensis TaxID=324768 RepID=A0A6I2MG97_9BACI|nr:cell wall-binding repeat-containing protein [Metabacillus idriensis]MRX56152.1 hypothetical protein [Metabacillus idriensis]
MKKSLALSVLFALCLPFGIASAAETPPTYRISGMDRFETSAKIAFEGWESSDVAVLATGRDYPDALSATPLAYKHDAPLLLTDKHTLTKSVAAELKELGVTKVYLIGGTGVISAEVEKELKAIGVKTITRIAGTDRYGTSVKIAKEVGITDSIVVASGENYPDALSIAPLAAIGQYPILLTRSADLPGSVKTYLKSLNTKGALVAGGNSVVSDNVLKSLPDPLRLGGSTRYSTNSQIIDFGVENGYFDMDYPFVVTGTNFPDALPASALAASWFNGVILTDPVEPKNVTKETVKGYADLVEEYQIIGGEKALPNGTVEKLFQ